MLYRVKLAVLTVAALGFAAEPEPSGEGALDRFASAMQSKSALRGFEPIADSLMKGDHSERRPKNLVSADFDGDGRTEYAILANRSYRDRLNNRCRSRYAVIFEEKGRGLAWVDTIYVEGSCGLDSSQTYVASYLDLVKPGKIMLFVGEERKPGKSLRLRRVGLYLKETISNSERLFWFDGKRYRVTTLWGGSC